MSTNAQAAQNARRQPTSIDVARLAGVSQSTVSRVLNGRNVSSDVRDAVLKAIDTLRYRPNTTARGLVTSKTGLIGIVIGDLRNGYYAESLDAINDQLAKHSTRPLIITDPRGKSDDPTQAFWDANVDGIIVTTSLLTQTHEDMITARDLPSVFLNRHTEHARDAVVSDSRQGGRLAAGHLLGLGHTRIAVITGPASGQTTQDRQEGFVEKLASSRVQLDPGMVISGDLSYDKAFVIADALLSRPDRPTAIFCHNDLMAMAVLNKAAELGIDVPSELSVVGFDDIGFSGWERIRLTTIRQPIRELGSTAVDVLFHRLQDPSRPPRTITLPSELITRASTAPPPA